MMDELGRYRRRRQVSAHSEALAASSEDGEWWATLYLLALLRDVALTQREAAMSALDELATG